MSDNAWYSALPYFGPEELACKGTGELRLDRRFAAQLPALRMAWGKPLHPTSVCRARSHNVAIGGHPRSLHLTDNPVHPVHGAMAADISWSTWSLEDRERFYRLALNEGWAVGLHPTFVHIDRRADFGLAPVTFHYPAWHGEFPDRPY